MQHKMERILLISIIAITFSLKVNAQAPFMMTFETSEPNQKIEIPIQPGFTYDYLVDWDGDGNYDEQFIDVSATHEYETPGIQKISITGVFPSIFFDNNSLGREKLVSIDQWGEIKWESMRHAFYGANNMVLLATDAPNLDGVTDLSGMFRECYLFDSDLNHWDVGKVTSLSNTFKRAYSFNGDITNWDTKGVTSLFFTFSEAVNFNRDIGAWNVSNVTNMTGTFEQAARFNQDIGGWDVSNVTTLLGTFQQASNFNQDLNAWNVGNVTFMLRTFDRASSFNGKVGDWDVRNVTSMFGMFDKATNFNQDISQWRIEKVNDLDDFLTDTNFGPDNYDKLLVFWAVRPHLDNVTFNADFDLHYCEGESGRQILIDDGWNILDAGKDCFRPFVTTWRTTSPNESITIGEIPLGNTLTYSYDVDWENDGIIDEIGLSTAPSHVYANPGDHQIAIYKTYPRIYINNHPDATKLISLDSWGDGAWLDLSRAFSGASNMVDKSNDLPHLESCDNLNLTFSGATNFNGDLSQWDISNIEFIIGTFKNATSFNSELNDWDVSNVNSLFRTFEGATSFNQDLSNWNVVNIPSMPETFKNATSFNQDLSSWDVANVGSFAGMFDGASSFDQNLGSWSLKEDVFLLEMFDHSGMSTDSYDQTLIGWATNNPPSNLELGAVNLTYCAGEDARNALLLLGWTINGDMLDCPDGCASITQSVYTGPDVGDWNTASNWTLDEVPDECNEVVIALDKSVSISNAADAHTLSVFEGAELSIMSFEFIVTGDQ